MLVKTNKMQKSSYIYYNIQSLAQLTSCCLIVRVDAMGFRLYGINKVFAKDVKTFFVKGRMLSRIYGRLYNPVFTGNVMFLSFSKTANYINHIKDLFVNDEFKRYAVPIGLILFHRFVEFHIFNKLLKLIKNMKLGDLNCFIIVRLFFGYIGIFTYAYKLYNLIGLKLATGEGIHNIKTKGE